jgi:hypothetical protein
VDVTQDSEKMPLRVLWLNSMSQKKAPSSKKWETAFPYVKGDFESSFCIKLLIYLSTTVGKI